MADVHINVDEPTDEELDMMRDRMYAFIFPNELRTDEERDAFEKAVVYQIAHEKTVASEFGELGVLQALPDGVSSFSIGTFSMGFGNGFKKSVTLDKGTICPYAYGVLLRAGLLYKGVLGGGCCGSD